MPNIRAIVSTINRRLSELHSQDAWDVISDDEWIAVSDIVEKEIYPLVASIGVDAVIEPMEAAKADPLVAAVLVDLCGRPYCLHSPSRGGTLRVDALFTDDEILHAAMKYLAKIYAGTLLDGEWAWRTLWNGLDKLSGASHLRLIRKLIERAPEDDRILWMIADGPVDRLIHDSEGEGQELVSLARSDPKVARVIALWESEESPA